MQALVIKTRGKLRQRLEWIHSETASSKHQGNVSTAVEIDVGRATTAKTTSLISRNRVLALEERGGASHAQRRTNLSSSSAGAEAIPARSVDHAVRSEDYWTRLC